MSNPTQHQFKIFGSDTVMTASTTPIQEAVSYRFTATADTIARLGKDAAVDIASTLAGKELSKVSDHPGPYEVTVEAMTADGTISGMITVPAS